MEQRIKEIVKKNEPFCISFRRELHMNPEVSFEEFRTTQRISEELTKHGIEHKVIQPSNTAKPTGIIAEIKGGKAGKTMALRADMDALAMSDLKESEYKSQVEGKMHGCGHDAHTAVLLTAAISLNEIKDEIPGNIRFFFQPAEELVKGAEVLIANGCMEGVSNIFGMHVAPSIKTGVLGAVAGPAYSTPDTIKIVFKGVGGHAAYPHTTVDTIVMASQFICNVQTIVSRVIPPVESAVVSFGKFGAGTRSNIIAHEAVLEGTARSFKPEYRDLIKSTMYRYANHIAEMYGGSVEIEYKHGTPPVVNEERSVELIKKVVTDNFGPEHLTKGIVAMGAEDFSLYLEKANGCFADLGIGNTAKNTEVPLHHGMFDVDEAALAFGAQVMCLYALAYLNQDDF